jgi:hypothetical protein
VVAARSLFDASLSANVGFVNLNDPARSTHGGERAQAHGFADTMGEKPSGFHAARKHPLDLAGRNAFLAGAHQVNYLKPKMQGQVRRFENSPLPNGELSFTFFAVVKAQASRFALQLVNALLIRVSAMGADWAIGPKLALDIIKRSLFVLKSRGVEGGIGHCEISYQPKPTSWGHFVKCNIAILRARRDKLNEKAKTYEAQPDAGHGIISALQFIDRCALTGCGASRRAAHRKRDFATESST